MIQVMPQDMISRVFNCFQSYIDERNNLRYYYEDFNQVLIARSSALYEFRLLLACFII